MSATIINAVPGKAWIDRPAAIRWTIRLAIALAIVCGTAYAIVADVVSNNAYYAGDMPRQINKSRFRRATAELLERAAWIQANATSGISYAWGEGGAAGTRFLRTGGASHELGVVRFGPFPDSAGGVAGLVENDTGAVVVGVSGTTAWGCGHLMRWMSPYTRGRASYAWTPLAGSPILPTAADVAAARWIQAPTDLAPCGNTVDASGTMLIRFDGPAGLH